MAKIKLVDEDHPRFEESPREEARKSNEVSGFVEEANVLIDGVFVCTIVAILVYAGMCYKDNLIKRRLEREQEEERRELLFESTQDYDALIDPNG